MKTSNEVWRDISGYLGLYKVSDLGRVKSYKRYSSGKLLKTSSVGGYLRYGLYSGPKQRFFLAHRLVAEAFITNTESKPFVMHKDDNRSNNVVSNLMWGDAFDNMRDMSSKNRQSIPKKSLICIETGVIFHSTKECSKILKVHNGHLCAHLNKRLDKNGNILSHTVGGLTFKYIGVNNE